jgi:hypothetical protein
MMVMVKVMPTKRWMKCFTFRKKKKEKNKNELKVKVY